MRVQDFIHVKVYRHWWYSRIVGPRFVASENPTVMVWHLEFSYGVKNTIYSFFGLSRSGSKDKSFICLDDDPTITKKSGVPLSFV